MYSFISLYTEMQDNNWNFLKPTIQIWYIDKIVRLILRNISGKTRFYPYSDTEKFCIIS